MFVVLLPHVDQDNLCKKWDPEDNRKNVEADRNAAQTQVIKLLICPSDELPETVVYNGAAVTPPGPGVSTG